MRIILMIVVMPHLIAAQQFQPMTFKGDLGQLNYQILKPKKIKEPLPLILFLHGAGERGSDNQKQLVHGSSLFLAKMKEYPSIVIFPQCPKEDYWSNVVKKKEGNYPLKLEFSIGDSPTTALNLVMQLLDSMVNTGKVDTSRIYVGGLSMGGMGTFEIVSRMPGFFAAAFPICGGGNEAMAENLTQTSFWIFHGAKDDVVLPGYSDVMFEAIRKTGGEVTYTVYPDANHNSWDPAFAEPGLFTWLFSKSKN